MKSALLAFLLLASPAWADDLGPICPDRPGKGTSACTVDAGHVQAELGLYDGAFQHRDGVTVDDTAAGALLLKYGVAPGFDIEAGLTAYQGERVHDGAADITQGGFGDLYLRGKAMLTGDGPFAAAIEPVLKIPTATNGTGNGKLEGGLVVPLAYDLGGGWSLASTPEADVALNGSGSGYHATAIDVVGLGKSLDGGWNLGAEIWTAQDFDPAGTTSQYSFDVSAAWLADNDTQLDGGLNFGLNRATPDTEVYFGVSRRF